MHGIKHRPKNIQFELQKAKRMFLLFSGFEMVKRYI